MSLKSLVRPLKPEMRVSGRCGHAFRKHLIERSPFDGVTIEQSTFDSRRQFVSREVVQRALEEPRSAPLSARSSAAPASMAG